MPDPELEHEIKKRYRKKRKRIKPFVRSPIPEEVEWTIPALAVAKGARELTKLPKRLPFMRRR